MTLQATDLLIVSRGGIEYKMDADQLKVFLQSDFIAATIGARDELTLDSGNEVYVIDATADTTVTTGGAKYIYDGTGFIKIAEDESFDVTIAPTNLAYVPSATNGLVTSSSGTDATIPAVTTSNAGLATPAMLAASHPAATASGTATVNPVTVDPTTQAVGFSIGQLAPLP